MRECEICFNDNLEDHSIVFLECAHSLCKSCYNRLLKDLCPFCRCKINREGQEKKKCKHTISSEEFILRLDELVNKKLHDKEIRKEKRKKYNKKNSKNSSKNSSKNPSNKNQLKNRRRSLRKSYDENSSKKEINKNKYIFTKGYKNHFNEDYK